MEFGCHINGYAVMVGTTEILGASESAPATGKAADVVLAAWYASIAAMKMLKPGAKNNDITKMIARIAEIYNVQPVQGVLSHEQTRFTVDGENAILNRTDVDHKVDEFEIGANEVYTLDIVMSTGEGTPKNREKTRCRVFKLNHEEQYMLKTKSARKLYSDANTRFSAMPFSLRFFEDGQSKLGMKELIKHGMVSQYPVTHEEDGELVAQFKLTVLVTNTNTMRISGQKLAVPFATSEFKIEDEEINTVLNSSTKRKKKKNKKKKKAEEAS
eukprot:TRINITY_DN8238_c0_g1_i1.p1 TRINITY_DN8238_c0_g1~~TRINITY_DN8238_c0_g1_i1.p1  ORF type:complete len:271 (+),score=124.01 TRINITY_DN8238_c0_g1_i1:795-1607(+)